MLLVTVSPSCGRDADGSVRPVSRSSVFTRARTPVRRRDTCLGSSACRYFTDKSRLSSTSLSPVTWRSRYETGTPLGRGHVHEVYTGPSVVSTDDGRGLGPPRHESNICPVTFTEVQFESLTIPTQISLCPRGEEERLIDFRSQIKSSPVFLAKSIIEYV